MGGERVIGAIVAWGASMPEPGVYEKTAAGGFALGRLEGDVEKDPALHKLATMLEAVGPVTVTKNLRGARWSKLALNAAISSMGRSPASGWDRWRGCGAIAGWRSR